MECGLPILPALEPGSALSLNKVKFTNPFLFSPICSFIWSNKEAKLPCNVHVSPEVHPVVIGVFPETVLKTPALIIFIEINDILGEGREVWFISGIRMRCCFNIQIADGRGLRERLTSNWKKDR